MRNPHETQRALFKAFTASRAMGCQGSAPGMGQVEQRQSCVTDINMCVYILPSGKLTV